MTSTKIIVLDDDPTGSQTVHGCLLLTRWDVDTLQQAYRIFFRSRLTVAEAAARVQAEVPPLPEVQNLVNFFLTSERGVTR